MLGGMPVNGGRCAHEVEVMGIPPKTALATWVE
jgi:hypothetical protein